MLPPPSFSFDRRLSLEISTLAVIEGHLRARQVERVETASESDVQFLPERTPTGATLSLSAPSFHSQTVVQG